MSRRRPLRDSAARRRAEERARRRGEARRAKRAAFLTIGLFAGGLLLGVALGILLGRGGLLPTPVSRLADRIGAGLIGADFQPGRTPDGQNPEEQTPGGSRDAALSSPDPGAQSTEAPGAHSEEGPALQSAEAGQIGVPADPVSSEALDAASAISLEPLPYPAMPGEDAVTPEMMAALRDPFDRTIARAGQPALSSPPIARANEAPASDVHVVYDEAEKAEPAPGTPVNLAALVELAKSAAQPAPAIRGRDRPVWQANAVSAVNPAGLPMIALVFDDLGLNRPNTRRVIELPGPLTLSFMTYAEELKGMTGSARSAGHELMVHMPMEPMDDSLDPGDQVLLAGMDQDEIRRRLNWGLERFSGYVGINNHMGSRFTAQSAGMAVVLAELKRRGLLFLDSKTAVNSVGANLANRFGVPFIERDIFIDNDPEDREAIGRQLGRLEIIARRRGAAVGIGHPHSATIEVLAPWLAELSQRGFALVPISTLVRRRIRLAEDRDSAG